jgi:NAD(P)-dependent dehydrogenase (short-subunit alcohol dehydrogenase family)
MYFVANGELDQRWVVVTGGAGGIGRAVCAGLASEGARPIVADVDAEQGERVAAQNGGVFVQCDLRDLPAAAAHVSDAVSSLTSSLAGVVSAAGVTSHGHFPDLTLDEWDRVIRINMTAPLFVVQALDGLLKRPGAAIVMITSAEATRVISTSRRSTPAYAAAKAGLKLITESLASDLAPDGIRVNAVAPGYTRTALTAALRERDADGWVERVVPIGKWGEPEDMADVVLFLLSDRSRYVSGASLVVDGGLTLGITTAMTGRAND